MGFQAPGPYEHWVAVQTALLSYNRPLILIFAFGIVFVLALLILGKLAKKIIWSFLLALMVTFAVGLYFVLTHLSRIRY